MKRSTKTLLVYGAVLGAMAAFVLFNKEGVPSGYTPIQARAGVSSPNIPTPANGQIAVVLPAGSRGWVAATRTSLLGVPAAVLVPGDASPLRVAGVEVGQALAIQWTDENGATQTAFFGFVAPGA